MTGDISNFLKCSNPTIILLSLQYDLQNILIMHKIGIFIEIVTIDLYQILTVILMSSPKRSTKFKQLKNLDAENFFIFRQSLPNFENLTHP